MRGRTSCISPARIRSGRPESTRFLDLIAIPSSTILALGDLALGPRPIDSVFHGGGVPKRRDPVDHSGWADAYPLSIGRSPLRGGLYFCLCSCCNRPQQRSSTPDAYPRRRSVEGRGPTTRPSSASPRNRSIIRRNNRRPFTGQANIGAARGSPAANRAPRPHYPRWKRRESHEKGTGSPCSRSCACGWKGLIR
jgi:hypothetical protein